MDQASEIPGNKRAFPVLTTARLIMREFSLSDVPAVFEMLRRNDMNEWLETDPLKSIAEAETRVRNRMGLFTDRMGFRWAITMRSRSITRDRLVWIFQRTARHRHGGNRI